MTSFCVFGYEISNRYSYYPGAISLSPAISPGIPLSLFKFTKVIKLKGSIKNWLNGKLQPIAIKKEPTTKNKPRNFGKTLSKKKPTFLLKLF